MSFILDALKKLEKNRQHSAVPDLLSDHRGIFRDKKKRVVWPYLIIAALILNAVALILWKGPWNSGKITVASTERVLTTDPVISETMSGNPPQVTMNNSDNTNNRPSEDSTIENHKLIVDKKDSPPKKESVVEEITTPAETPLPLSLDPSEGDLKTLREKIKEERKKVIPEPDEINTDDADISAVNDRAVQDFSQLPADTKKEIPAISISGHIFSDNQKSRIVNINGGIFREGEMVDRGLKLDEITVTGVILDYQGTRVSVSAF